MDIKRKLYWLKQAGISYFCAEKPLNQTPNATTTDDTPATVQATASANQANDLPTLNQDKESFNLSALKKTAAHTILGQGHHKPKLMSHIDTSLRLRSLPCHREGESPPYSWPGYGSQTSLYYTFSPSGFQPCRRGSNMWLRRGSERRRERAR